MLDLYEEFRRVVAALEERKLPYAVCRGLAFSILVQPRATVDIDLLVPEEAYEPVAAAVLPLGFKVFASPMVLGRGRVHIRRLTKLEEGGPDALVLDLLLAKGQTARAAWRSRRRVMWGDGAITVVSKGGLAFLKRLRSSPQDLVDIAALRRKT